MLPLPSLKKAQGPRRAAVVVGRHCLTKPVSFEWAVVVRRVWEPVQQQRLAAQVGTVVHHFLQPQ